MPSWLQGVLNTCPLAAKFKGERLPIPAELRQLPYFEKRFKNKYAHLYKAHDERGLKCPMDVKTMEDMVSFCQHVLRSDDIMGTTKDVARVFLARVLNVYNGEWRSTGSTLTSQRRTQSPVRWTRTSSTRAATSSVKRSKHRLGLPKVKWKSHLHPPSVLNRLSSSRPPRCASQPSRTDDECVGWSGTS